MDTTQLILDTFYNPDSGFVGVQKMYNKLKKYGITQKQISDILRKQEIVQVNQKPGLVSSFIPDRALQEFQIDLIYLENEKLNEAKYGLCCIDVFSKKASVELMKKKTASDTVAAMEKIFPRMGIPETVYCDEGSEFDSTQFKNLMKKHNIRIIYTLTHAPVVERFNRTIKEMLSKYMQASESKTIAKVLPRIVKNYNTSYHTSIGMAPNNVTKENEDLVWFNLWKKSKKRVRPDVHVGDKVRVQLKPRGLDKKYKPQYSKAIHVVEKIDNGLLHVSNSKRAFLKAHVMKVNDVEKKTIDPDILGTLEGRLKEMAKQKPTKSTAVIQEEVKKRPPRKRKLPKKLSIFQL